MGCGTSTPAQAASAAPVKNDEPSKPQEKKPEATTPAAAPSAPKSAAAPPAKQEATLEIPAVAGSIPSDATIIFVLGGPGSGKGTQCDKIKAKYAGVVHLSAGDLLRDEVKSGSPAGAQLEATMKEGKLVPVQVTITLLKNAMIKSGGKVFLIDGFPRALDQAEVFESGIAHPKCVLFFDCPEDEMEKRLLKRGETSGRADDNAETIRKRFKTFIEQSLPVKTYYEGKGLAKVISAVPHPDEVFIKVQEALDPIMGVSTSSAAPAAKEDAPLVIPEVEGSIPADASIIFVLGGPGSGKGTQCDKIKAKYAGVVHLSAGDLLRDEVKSGSPAGAQLEATMKEGKLVPVQVTITLLKNAMIKSGGKMFLIDGFPRALDQAEVFESGIAHPKCVLFFDCPEDEMEKRLLKRGETSGRADDNAETIRKRFKTFIEQSLPVKTYYEGKGLAKVISAVPHPDEVFVKVQEALDPIMGVSTPAAAPEGAPLVVPEVAGHIPADASIIFVLGGPGSGKGTQCDKIKAKYPGVVHLSAGDLLRDEVKSGSAVGAQLEATMKEGKLVPVQVTITLLKNAMIKSGGKVFLIDGFPRALDQAEVFESGIAHPKCVLFFDCPEDEMEKRLLKRGETSGRADDNAETIRKRFKTFVEQSLPVKGHYAGKGLAFEISAVPHPDEVFAKVQEVLDPLLSSEIVPAKDAPLVIPEVEGSISADASIIFVLGGPGSGKGTQCDKIKAKYAGVVHLSAGDLLRDEVKSGSPAGAQLEATMKEGKLVPVQVTITLLKNAMIKSGGSFFLIDGFPRALDQAEVFESGIAHPKCVLFFDCPEDEMEKRLLKRGETSGRADDNAETIRKRFKTFIEQSLPVKTYYEGKGLAKVISAVPHPDEVFVQVQEVLDPIAPASA